jgi:hypothetical protein
VSVTKLESSVTGKPKSGERCNIRLGEHVVEGTVDLYFDDKDGIEHAYIWVGSGPHKMHVLRPTTEVR